MASSIQPEERISSLAYTFLSSKVRTKLGYRDAVQMLNLFLYHKEEDSIKLRTLADFMEQLGEKIEDQLAEAMDRILAGIGMGSVMKSVLAFLLFNGLLQNELVFFTDGARNIKSNIGHFFSFRPYTIVLDWFHLKKKSQELLSMALKRKYHMLCNQGKVWPSQFRQPCRKRK